MLPFKKTNLLFISIVLGNILMLDVFAFWYNRFLAGIILVQAVLFFLLYDTFSRRKNAENKLTDSEERFRLFIEHVRDYAIFMIDPDGKIMSWNQGAQHIKGYTEAEIIGQPISIFYTDEENCQGEPAYNLERAKEEGHFECVGWRKRKDGSLFWADVALTSLCDESGKLLGFAKITRDITQYKKTEEGVWKALAREKELNEMKSRFVALASHEFKTPLSVILSSISLIGKYQGMGPELDEKRIKHVYRIKSHVNNLKQILNDFLSIEKLESGLISNSPGEVDLLFFVNEIIADMNEACKAGQEIILQVIGPPEKAWLDGQMLRNVLNNLLSNAIKYSPECSEIRLTLQFETGCVRFDIKDCGIGIPKEEQEHLFERFFRATNTTGISGTGLGLSIVKRYLDLMGGTIHLKSEKDKGTEFTVAVPSVNIYHYAELHHHEA